MAAAGRTLRHMPARERARLLSFVPQHPQTDIRFPVEDFVSMGSTACLGAFSRPGRAEIQRAKDILRGLGCGHLTGRGMDQVSGGERRMAYLARAVMQSAPWLLLDEPVASLDFSRQHTFLRALQQYVREQNAGCLLTIHDPVLAHAYCGRLVLLHGGRVREDITVGSPGYEGRLAEALRALYGEQVSVSFPEGGMAMGWMQK